MADTNPNNNIKMIKQNKENWKQKSVILKSVKYNMYLQ